ncbi:MAG: hypothetical protein LBH40_05875 [Alphaproteobacteria bacterium]|jgi:hypothetical protein|nr:hypothetical protein [Alphaproteobacteria bacterium]
MQARNFPKTTSLITTEDSFISDDGNITKTDQINKILEIYDCLIGSGVVLNETDNVVIQENQLKKTTYLRIDKLSIRLLREYPKLYNRFNQQNINQLQGNTLENEPYLGYTDVYKRTVFQEEQHTHKFLTETKKYTSMEYFFSGMYDNGGSSGAKPSDGSLGDYGIPAPNASFAELIGDQTNSSESISAIDGIETAPASYFANLYIIAKIDLK